MEEAGGVRNLDATKAPGARQVGAEHMGGASGVRSWVVIQAL